VHIHIFQDQNIHGISEALLGSEHSSNIRISRAHYSIQGRETGFRLGKLNQACPSVPQVSLAINFTNFSSKATTLTIILANQPSSTQQQTDLTRLKRYQ